MNRYANIPELKTSTGTRYLGTTFYPEIPYSESDIYVYTTEGDRLDNLSQQYYGDTTLYWVIASANATIPFASLFIIPGTQLRIPGDISSIISSFNQLNESR
jgi:phage tail protein X